VPPSGDALRLPLDEFQHAATVAAILDEFLATAARPLRLLEICQSNPISLAQFLDPLQVTIASGRLTPEGTLELLTVNAAETDERGQLADGAFDAVVGLNLLENIAARQRTAALRECQRIAKLGVVGTAVNRVPTVCRLEELADEARLRPNDLNSDDDERQPMPLLSPAELQIVLRAVGPHVVELDCVPSPLWFALQTLDDTLSHHGAIADLRARVQQHLLASGSSVVGTPYRKAFVCGTSSRAVAHLREHPLASPAARVVEDDTDTVAAALRCAADLASHVLEELHRELDDCRGQVHAQNVAIHARDGELAGIRNTGAWRMAAPLRWIEDRGTRLWTSVTRTFWRGVWSVFPCRYTLRHLKPAHEIERDSEPGSWEATGHDPQFIFRTPRISGWLWIHVRIRSSVSGRVMLYFDHGTGFNGNDVSTVGSLRADKWVEFRQTVWHEQAIHALRFDPTDAPAFFTIERFEVGCIPGWLRVGSVLWPRIAAAHARGSLGKAVRSAIGLLLRGDFVALRQKLSNRLGQASVTLAESQYQVWRELHQPRLAALPNLSNEQATSGAVPKPSLLFCPGSASLTAVKRCVESILRQTSPHWELCVAYDTTTPDRVRRWLAHESRSDRRVRIASETGAASPVAAINLALSITTGDFIARLNPGDELAAHALRSVAQACLDRDDVDVLYADEDRVHEFGEHSDPFFKPDWSPEHLLACNYLGPFTLIRTSLVREVGGYREEFADAVDYDLALRCVTRASRVHHISDVLCHRGESLENVSASGGSLHVAAAERKALEAHLQSTGQTAIVEPGFAPNTHRVRWPARGEPIVSVVIPSACGKADIRGESTWFVLKCVQSIRQRSTYPRLEIVVVDNNDMPPDLERELRPYDVRRVSFVEPFNLSAKMNFGASHAQGEHLILLNDDIEVITPEWIESLLDFSQHDEVGTVGAKLLFPNGCLQHVGVTILDGNPGHPFYMSPGDCPGYFHSTQIHRNYVAVTGACVMTRASVFRELGGFDVRFPLNYNDVDYCLRVLESGRRNVYTPYAQLYHHESVSKSGTTLDELANFKRKWGVKYRVDPYYNPNLTMTRSDYAIITADAA
jgi:GT2 family glycosyltransferase